MFYGDCLSLWLYICGVINNKQNKETMRFLIKNVILSITNQGISYFLPSSMTGKEFSKFKEDNAAEIQSCIDDYNEHLNEEANSLTTKDKDSLFKIAKAYFQKYVKDDFLHFSLKETTYNFFNRRFTAVYEINSEKGIFIMKINFTRKKRPVKHFITLTPKKD